MYPDKQKPYDPYDVETKWVKWDSCRDKCLNTRNLQRIDQAAENFTQAACTTFACIPQR